MATASEQNKGTLAKWFNTLTSEQMARFLSDGQAVEDFLNSALYREDLFGDAIPDIEFITPDGRVPVEQAVNISWPRLTPDQMFGTTWRGERPTNSPIDAEDFRDIYVQEFLRRVAGVPTYEQADLNEDGRISQAEAAVDLEKLEELIASENPGTRSDILGQVFGDYISPDNPLSEELIETLLGKIPNYDAAENVSVDDLTDEQKAAWELLKENDRGMTTVGILGAIFGPDFDTATLNRELVNLVLRSWGKDFNDFQNDIMRDDKGGNNQGGNQGGNNPGGNIPGGNNPGGNNPGGNDDGNNDNDNGGGMDLRSVWDWVTKVFGPGLDPKDQSIIDLINIALGDQSQTTDVDATGGTSTSDATGGTSTSDSTSDSTSTVGDTTATGGNVGDTSATGGNVGDTSATGGSVGDTTATGGAGGAGGQGGQASAAGGAGGQGGQAAGGAGGIGQGGIGQGGVGQGGSAAGGSVGDTTTGSQSIGDTITDVVNTFVQNAPDVVGAAIRDEIARKYEADQLKDASDAELALLRELMETREDVYAPFYSLGGVAPGPDGIFNTADDITYLDETLDEYRTAIKEPFDPRIDLMDERGTGQLVDPQPSQFNIAQMVSEVGRGALPDAMYSDVNQIDPFNPQDAGLRFLQDEGRRAIEASSAAAGRLNSGGTLAELQNQAIGTAAQYAQNLANIGQTQDTTRLTRDQQYYNQLIGNQEQLFGQDLEQLAAMQLAQDAQDRVQLAADTARFESGQAIGQQKFNQAGAIAEQDYGLANRPANALASLLGISESGATGLTGGDSGYLQAGYGSSAGSPYSGLGDISLKNDDNKIGMLGNILGNIFK